MSLENKIAASGFGMAREKLERGPWDPHYELPTHVYDCLNDMCRLMRKMNASEEQWGAYHQIIGRAFERARAE